MNESLSLEWCTAPSASKELAAFFVREVTPNYISHGELQAGRAESMSRWSPTLEEKITAELARSISLPMTEDGWQGVVVARQSTSLVAFALVRFETSSESPYGVIEDLVVSSSQRGHGFGQRILDWIEIEAGKRGMKFLFLESGIANTRAHTFFETQGFQQCSITMMKELPK